MAPPGVVVIGPSSWNTLVEVAGLPEPRSHTLGATRHWRGLGGTSAGKALHLADLGISTACFTAVGDDDDGRSIVSALTTPMVELTAWVSPGPSEHHLNLMTPAGDRLSIYLDGGPLPTLSATDIAATQHAIMSAHTVVLDLASLCLPFVDTARESPARVWTDLHDYNGDSEFHRPFRTAADVVVMNNNAVNDPLPLLREMVSEGCVAAVCTLGADGAVGVTHEGRAVRVDAVPTSVVDTNGAGDAFMAGMIAASAQGARGSSLSSTVLHRWMTSGSHQAVRALLSHTVGPARSE